MARVWPRPRACKSIRTRSPHRRPSSPASGRSGSTTQHISISRQQSPRSSQVQGMSHYSQRAGFGASPRTPLFDQPRRHRDDSHGTCWPYPELTSGCGKAGTHRNASDRDDRLPGGSAYGRSGWSRAAGVLGSAERNDNRLAGARWTVAAAGCSGPIKSLCCICRSIVDFGLLASRHD